MANSFSWVCMHCTGEKRAVNYVAIPPKMMAVHGRTGVLFTVQLVSIKESFFRQVLGDLSRLVYIMLASQVELCLSRALHFDRVIRFAYWN